MAKGMDKWGIKRNKRGKRRYEEEGEAGGV
jgi:hypothetical protein